MAGLAECMSGAFYHYYEDVLVPHPKCQCVHAWLQIDVSTLPVELSAELAQENFLSSVERWVYTA